MGSLTRINTGEVIRPNNYSSEALKTTRKKSEKQEPEKNINPAKEKTAMPGTTEYLVERYKPKNIPMSPTAQMDQARISQSGASEDVNWGRVSQGVVTQGADQFINSLLSTGAFIEGLTTKPLERLTGIENFAAMGPWATASRFMKNVQEENQATFQPEFEKAGATGELLDKYGTATVAAIPQAALALLTAGSSLGSQATTAGLQAASASAASAGLANTVSTAATNMLSNPQYWFSLSQMAGPAYDQAKADGANELEATSYAMLTGLVNSAVEIGGGLETLPQNLRQAASGGQSGLHQWVKSAFDEGKEEVVQGAISQLSQAVYGKNNPFFSTTDQKAVISPSRAAEEFTGGAVVGGILGGGQMLAGNIANSSRNGTGPNTTETRTPTVLETEAQRLFGNQQQQQEITPPEPPVPSPVLQETPPSADIPVQETPVNASQSVLDMLTGNQRISENDLSREQMHEVENYWEQGTVGFDASGNVFRQDPNLHIDNRTNETVSNRNVNAFQYDNPTLQRYISQAAQQIINDADTSLQIPSTRRAERTTQGITYTQNITETDAIRQAMNMGMTRNQIITAAEKLIADMGQENNVGSKRLELVLDNMLTNGYTGIDGTYYPPNEAYIADKSRIAGAKEGGYQQSEELPIWDIEETSQQNVPRYDNLGSARMGFTEQGMEGVERTSRLAESFPYTQAQEAATALSKEDYENIFRYRSQTEERSMNLAEELVYYLQDGKRTFIRDISEQQYQELIKALDDAPAWNAPMIDAAHLIQTELQGRSANMEIESEEYVDFLRMMREHETSTGQGIQANAKWSRANNEAGSKSELDAWDNLQKSNLTEDQKAETFQRIVKWDNQIESVSPGDTQAMKDIILQIGQERGVLNGLSGNQSNLLYSIADKSLDGLDFDQLKQFAYASTEAMSTDSIPVNIGQKIKTIQVLNMLSSPITPARNLAGNTTFYGIDAAAMNVSSLLDWALSNITGTRSIAYEGSPISRQSLQAAAKAAQMSAAEVTLDVDMGTGNTRYGTGGKRTFKASGNFVDQVISSLERNQGYLLQTSDEFFKGLARSTEARTQRLIDQGKIKTDNQNYASEQAQQLARYRTFQDESRISVGIQQIHDILNLVGFGDSGRTIKGKTVKSFGPGDIVAPFTKVAGNLVSRSAEYSPLNILRGTYEISTLIADAARGRAVDPSRQAQAVSDFGRGATGTALAFGFMLLARSGLLRKADDEDDENVRALNQSEGLQGTQLNIDALGRALQGNGTQWQTGDTLVDLSSIQPLNFLMNLGTEMAKGEQNPIVSSFNATTDSLLDASAELPVMGFIGDTATNVVRYNQPIEESLANSAAYTVTSSLIPNVLRAVAKGIDDRPRNTYAGDTLLEDVVSNIKNSVPGLRETLPGSVNAFGEEKTYGTDPGWQLFNSLINPTGVNTYTQTEVSKELENLRENTGETNFYPSKSIPSQLSYTDDNGKTTTKDLTYEERQAFQQERGTLSYDTIDRMTNSSTYKSASDEEKSALLNRCEEYAYETAKEKTMGISTAPQWVSNAKNAQRDLGVSTEEYLSLYEKYGAALSGNSYENVKEAVKNGMTVDEYMNYKDSVSGLEADKDENGKTISGSKKEKVLNAINNLDLSSTEKDWLYYLNGYSESTIEDAPWR